ncbi:NAD-dependent epimerase/dehydratase family protein [Paraliomyxa miuraensis]|uniref:NAD-dependent epimerase/dehydratase family protein n=1 Tax=Paraliomyxa miuraensis TaxID=376150 RepID=UPI0022584135|nr:NAD-dependent epimerase/dehydratase family protein [Paraliomyxa miuraensis]MCX4243146.1 GDP-mannose 4,6-dehydratase [Paraliomyxa miuraensis]
MGLGAARRTVLVTGAAGFIGSHLSERLLAEGFEVVGLDNLMTGDIANLAAAGRDSHFHLEIGDVRDTLPVYAEMIFNLACPASPVHYQSDPAATLTTSVLGALRLAEQASLRRVRIIHASTSEVYGDPLEHPQRESYWGNVNPVGERACYDEGKRAAETILMDAHRARGSEIRIVRIFNTYGPRMALDDGRVISSFVRQAIEGVPLTLHGDGQQTRSFCYIDDLIEGLVRFATKDEITHRIINLGNPHELTIAELADVLRRVVGKNLPVVRRPLPPDDPRRRRPDISLARSMIGFEPRVSIEHGIAATHADFVARLEQEHRRRAE